jgi:hypothetical protein
LHDLFIRRHDGAVRLKGDQVMAREQIGATIQGWQQLKAAMDANAEDFPHLAEHSEELGELLSQAQQLNTQQAALTASKQVATLRLGESLRDGNAVAAFLRAGVRKKYGRDAEKLLEFGMRPARPRRRPEPDPPSPEPPSPPVEIAAGAKNDPA